MLRRLLIVLLIGCTRSPSSAPIARPSILLITLDTTRADAIGPEQTNVETPAFNALAARGLRFRQAYTTAPQTLPAHISILTGLYPGGHGVHENGRYLASNAPLLAERLRSAGYRTAAFVSAFAVARRFGLARGFDVYDDEFGEGRAERTAGETTDRVLAYLGKESRRPLFLWVHYYDPHDPYTPPEPFRTRYAKQPYFGEIASMDQQLGRLTNAFQAIVIVGDHGEGLGEHGEAQHGNLLYQPTMHVPLLMIGPGISAGVSDTPVSTRNVFHTVLNWAGISEKTSASEVVLAEAMAPFLDYGWQPQVMALKGRMKLIAAGTIEMYDVIADPAERHDLAGKTDVSRDLRAALRDYPIPLQDVQPASPATEEERRKLASLGYVSATTKPVLRRDAPRPADRTSLFPLLDQAGILFVREQYREAIPLLEQIIAEDPHNLVSALQLATAHSSLGHDQQALVAFRRAEAIDPNSEDVRMYLALHDARGKEWQRAVPLLERIVAKDPNRLPALEALAVIRERQERLADAVALRQKIYRQRTPTPRELVRLGQLAMAAGQTAVAIEAFEKAHSNHDLELGVLYLAAGRLDEARDALDRVPPSSPDYPMALFKRAQVSVLLHEPDKASRIESARQHADATTRELIVRERLFR
jgi:arylsulfatase A-like enzyme/Tfp pilus assembly protein PilF